MSELFPMPPEFKHLVDQILYLARLPIDAAIAECEEDCDCKELLKLLNDYKEDDRDDSI